MNFANFKDAKHPSAKMRNDAVVHKVKDYGFSEIGEERSFGMSCAMEVFRLSENFLHRQYYHRDCAIEALESGDTNTALEHLKSIGDSGHGITI